MLNNTVHLSAVIALCAVFTAPAAGQELVTVAWRIKPPHQYLENGIGKGLLLERARLIFEKAGIPVKFVEQPAKRIWNNFTEGMSNYCSFGWYKVPERESLVHYSRAFYADPPHTLLVSPASLPQVSKYRGIQEIMGDPGLTLGLLEAVSYGKQLDQFIRNSQNKLEYSAASPMIMARMVAANRVSYTLIDQADWSYLKERETSLRVGSSLTVQDMPPGENRYVVCSKDISSTRMTRINAAIQQVNATKKPSRFDAPYAL
jgi:polar amino acid transport system substrate-binding protein